MLSYCASKIFKEFILLFKGFPTTQMYYNHFVMLCCCQQKDCFGCFTRLALLSTQRLQELSKPTSFGLHQTSVGLSFKDFQTIRTYYEHLALPLSTRTLMWFFRKVCSGSALSPISFLKGFITIQTPPEHFAAIFSCQQKRLLWSFEKKMLSYYLQQIFEVFIF